MEKETISWTIDTKQFYSKKSKSKRFMKIFPLFALIITMFLVLLWRLLFRLHFREGLSYYDSFYKILVFLIVASVFICLFFLPFVLIGYFNTRKHRFMKYTVNSKGVVVNEKFFEWEKFKYYSTESQTFDFMDKTLSRSSGKDTSTSGFGSISLFKDSNGFKGTLTLLIDYDDAPLHERVFSIVSKHLISYYSQDFNKVSLLQVIIGILLLAIVVLIDLFILPLF